MIDFKVHADQGILAIKVTGKLTKEDLEALSPALKEHIAASDDPHLLMILEDFKGWKDAAAFWKDLQLDAEYIGYFDRIAIVGDKKWQEWGTRLVNPITKEELTFFSLKEADKAWKWVGQNHSTA